MPQVPASAAEHYAAQRQITVGVLAAVRALWRQMRLADFDGSWLSLGPRIMRELVAAQREAATGGLAYVPDVLAELGIQAQLAGQPSVGGLVGVASSGYDLTGVLYEPVIRAKQVIAAGASSRQGLLVGGKLLNGIVTTQVADAGRVAAGLSIVARPAVAGYVRMLNPPSCSRCVVLAGKFYRWNAGFERHPRCDCRHIPAHEDMAGDLRTDPRAYFDSLAPAKQDEVFTVAGARAIRDGADISQVVNARRGAAGLSPAGARITRDEARALQGGRSRGRLATASVYGHELYVTSEGTTARGVSGRQLIERFGATVEAAGQADRVSAHGKVSRVVTRSRASAPRLMPESIYEIAADRDDAIRLLRLNGYLT